MMKAAAFSSIAAIIRTQEIQFEQWMPHRLRDCRENCNSQI